MFCQVCPKDKQEYCDRAAIELRNSPMKSQIEKLKDQIEVIPDFPKPGIQFQDVFSLFETNPENTLQVQELSCALLNSCGIEFDVIVMLEARGFILGPMISSVFKVPMIPLRKPGKLAQPTLSITYQKEYGTDTIHIKADALRENSRVLIVDDLMATGGTAAAAIELVRKAKALPVLVFTLLEVTALKSKARENLGIVPHVSLFSK
jgi:adenine phosphoribosyltransferase